MNTPAVAWRLIPNRTGCTRWSKKRTEKRLGGWWFTKQMFIESSRAQGR
jgi:hypothetical protein